ncbi:hypothetical protein PYCCODRAFT_856695 [Trametes coccinea BRFM310]|uniref:Uncharacterized protein n=1 Tax=Trametes coccinea (strain BRFM310) TaxID=1353009 RepID=A0A1Y2IDS9_TRAC3|nr:hypothetical protein PYCCODRAFT_856695 [Trametes coccinea BRFM310]
MNVLSRYYQHAFPTVSITFIFFSKLYHLAAIRPAYFQSASWAGSSKLFALGPRACSSHGASPTVDGPLNAITSRLPDAAPRAEQTSATEEETRLPHRAGGGDAVRCVLAHGLRPSCALRPPPSQRLMWHCSLGGILCGREMFVLTQLARHAGLCSLATCKS